LSSLSLNDALKSLNAVNTALAPTAADGSARASLEDQRDQLIGFIAGKIDVKVTIGKDGRATLAAGANGSMSLLSNSGPSLVSLVPAADGRLSLQVSTNGAIAPLPAAGGTLAGLVDLSQTIADRRSALDGLAADFTSMVNTWSAAGKDANGNAGANLISTPAGATSMQTLADGSEPRARRRRLGHAERQSPRARRGPRVEQGRGSLVGSGFRQCADAVLGQGRIRPPRRNGAIPALPRSTK